MNLTVESTTFDAEQPEELAKFWAFVFDAEPIVPSPYVALVESPGRPRFLFLQVPEHKTAKNRCHVDLHADDEAAVDAEVERLTAAGAALVDHHREYGTYWATLRDPEGNEFCIGTPDHSHT